jgi:hypothetical protein
MTTKPKPESNTDAAKPNSKAASAVVPDWSRIELDYRAGIKPLRQIASEHGVSHTAIGKRAKRDDWQRDLAVRIQAKAEELVSREAVSRQVSTETRVSEREIVEANALAVATVRLSHRKDITRSRRIVMSLFDELEYQTGADNVAMLEELGELMRSEGDNGQDRLNDLYQKIVSLPGRAKTMKDLGESLRVMIMLERQAFGLDDKEGLQADALSTLLNRVTSGNANSFAPVADDPEHDEG